MRLPFVLVISALTASAALAKTTRNTTTVPRGFQEEISRHALAHGVPETLIHRIVLRESRYNPALVSRGHYGLMQISYATARSMGYRGAPAGLLNPDVNLTYGVPYLANAYRTAGGSETGAVSLYSRGYYYVAKKRGLVPHLRTAHSPSLEPAPAEAAPEPAPEPENPFLRFFRSQVPAGESPRN
jgi:soluble lytic murein transglycosylase-like protein